MPEGVAQRAPGLAEPRTKRDSLARSERGGSGGRAASAPQLNEGEVREWLNRAVSKTVVPYKVPWVRIPPSPPYGKTRRGVCDAKMPFDLVTADQARLTRAQRARGGWRVRR